MNERRIRKLFLEHVQELAGTDKLEVYVDIPDFVRSANIADLAGITVQKLLEG